MTNDGGPAFPMVTDFCPLKGIRSTEGMSLRDYFAGQLMPSMLNTFDSFDEAAEAAYEAADAMLAERAKSRCEDANP